MSKEHTIALSRKPHATVPPTQATKKMHRLQMSLLIPREDNVAEHDDSGLPFWIPNSEWHAARITVCIASTTLQG
jgi:hypothetical protein